MLSYPCLFTVVLNFRHTDDTLRCVGSLQRSTCRNQRLVVVDNASTAATRAALHQGLPATTVLASEDNLGYAGGNNLGIRHALERAADFVWILNPDIVVTPESLERLLRTAWERPDAGIIGCRVLYGGAAPSRIWFNGGLLDWTDAGATSHLDDGMEDSAVPATGPFATDYVTGAAMLVRREVFEEVGLLPTDYFLYFEETEFNLRAQRAGWSSLVEPRAKLVHHKRSTGRLPAPYYVYYFVRNRLRFATTVGHCDFDDALASVEGWTAAWRTKVAERDPAWLPTYEQLLSWAVDDARRGVRGRRDDIDSVPASGAEVALR